MTQNEHLYAICYRPKVAGDVSSCENVKIIERYAALKFEVASCSSFRDIPKNHFVSTEAETDIAFRLIFFITNNTATKMKRWWSHEKQQSKHNAGQWSTMRLINLRVGVHLQGLCAPRMMYAIRALRQPKETSPMTSQHDNLSLTAFESFSRLYTV